MSASKLEIDAPAGETSFFTRRTVRAPASLVFEAFTKPEYLARWMGPASLTLVSCDLDLRVGGAWRMVYRAPDGQEVGFRGEFREVERPTRIVRTFIYEPLPQYVAVETLRLEERDGQTTIHTETRHETVEARDGHLNSGMEAGVKEGYERLDTLLASLR